MSRLMLRSQPQAQPLVLDPEVWEAPGRLTEDDFHIAAGPDWRRRRSDPDSMENDE